MASVLVQLDGNRIHFRAGEGAPWFADMDAARLQEWSADYDRIVTRADATLASERQRLDLLDLGRKIYNWLDGGGRFSEWNGRRRKRNRFRRSERSGQRTIRYPLTRLCH